ncbi:hypothetical protein LXL04_014211 [Taraxacum kok-saghyz]
MLWTIDAEMHLESMGIREAINFINDCSLQDKARAHLSDLQHHREPPPHYPPSLGCSSEKEDGSGCCCVFPADEKERQKRSKLQVGFRWVPSRVAGCEELRRQRPFRRPWTVGKLLLRRETSDQTYPKGYSIREVRGSRPIPGLVTSAAYTTKSALCTHPKGYSIREVRGSRPIPGLVTSAAYTTKSALLFVVQVLIRSLLS